MQNLGAEKYWESMLKCQKQGRKWSPKGSQKSTKSMYKSMPEKRIEKVEKIAQPRRPWHGLTGQKTLLELLNQPTDYLNGRSNSLYNDSGKVFERVETMRKFDQLKSKMMRK